MSLLCDLAWVVIWDVNPLSTLLQLMIVSSAKNHDPLYIFDNRQYVQEDYAWMVDVDKDILYQMHAAADYLNIKPLLEMTSLAFLIGYMWASVL